MNRRRADAKIFLHVGFGGRPAMQAHVQVDKRQILALLGRKGFCSATHSGHPIQLFVRASTGAASGIGAACARRMARDGAQLLLADQNGDSVKSLAEELGHISVQANVTDADDIQRMLDLAYRRWGRLDVLFNNAGIAEVRPLLELTEKDWDRMLAVNLRAVFFVLQGTAKRMRQQSPIAGSELRGKLIQTASIAAYRGGLANMPHYAASKAGVVSITRTAAQVLAADRITSNCICPGAVDTPMWRKIDAEWTKIEGWEIGEAWKRAPRNP